MKALLWRQKHRRNKDGSVVTYLQLVENKRVGSKIHQRVLCTLGWADDPKRRADLQTARVHRPLVHG